MDTSEKLIPTPIPCFWSAKMANDSYPPSFCSSNTLDDNSIEIEKLLSMDFKKKKDGTPDGRFKNYRRLNTLANESPCNINLNGSPDLRYTKNPEILKIKLSKILEAQRKTN